ncbi:MAG: tRNA (adenosine(37)-N6)-threonylcarbamoyltransferase complex ATPase subunit type 1 TsaE [Lachnospiraceae bacterium]|nr:tRNA (adenosine(37)-N6)-threonylcarbamoyltransferase complex ATPase subunit type 1 TsaE [Lachnospiraceae bacterium]
MAREVFESFSAEDTLRFGIEMGKKVTPGTVIALTGDLGVGKTLFSKGFAEGLGVKEPTSSPTFTILQVYDSGRIPFYHFDVYRIADPEEMDEIGFDTYIYGDGVSVIEWAELISELIPESAIHITIEKDLEKGFDYRKITVETV